MQVATIRFGIRRKLIALILLTLILPTTLHSAHKELPSALPAIQTNPPPQSEPQAETLMPCVSQFSENFSSDPNINGRWHIYRNVNDAQYEASWDKQNGVFYLTRLGSYLGVASFANYQLRTTRWEARFKYKAGGGTGADGIIFMFYKKEINYPTPGYGGFLGFQENFGANHPGYGIEFDNYYNPYDGIGDPSERHIALIQDSVGNHLKYVNDERTEDNAWHNVVVRYTDGLVVVSVDGKVTLEHTISKPNYEHFGVGFSSATGIYDNNHIIDDFTIEANCSAALTSSITFLPFVRR